MGTLLLVGVFLLWRSRSSHEDHSIHPSPPAPTTILTNPYIAPPNQNEQPSIPSKTPLSPPSPDKTTATSPEPALESVEALRARFLPDLGDPVEAEREETMDMGKSSATREPFSEETIASHGANLGPSRWMANMPDMELQIIEEKIAVETERTELALAEQERERILHDHVRFLTTRAALRCANHNLATQARCVVRMQRASLINHRGLIRGVSSSANLAAGSRPMERCLNTQLEGARFHLELDDTSLGPIAITVGEGAP